MTKKTKKRFIIQKKTTPSESSCCLNEKETTRKFKVNQILNRKKKYGKLFVKGFYFRNDATVKDDVWTRKIKSDKTGSLEEPLKQFIEK